MEHIFFSSGNNKAISWVIETEKKTVEQKRKHAEIYFEKVTVEQSKYIALHVGIFWGIGTFIIKDGDIVNIMLDSQAMYNQLYRDSTSHDEFSRLRIKFIKKLIEQRKLNIVYHVIDSNKNLAEKLL